MESLLTNLADRFPWNPNADDRGYAILVFIRVDRRFIGGNISFSPCCELLRNKKTSPKPTTWYQNKYFPFEPMVKTRSLF